MINTTGREHTVGQLVELLRKEAQPLPELLDRHSQGCQIIGVGSLPRTNGLAAASSFLEITRDVLRWAAVSRESPLGVLFCDVDSTWIASAALRTEIELLRSASATLITGEASAVKAPSFETASFNSGSQRSAEKAGLFLTANPGATLLVLCSNLDLPRTPLNAGATPIMPLFAQLPAFAKRSLTVRCVASTDSDPLALAINSFEAGRSYVPYSGTMAVLNQGQLRNQCKAWPLSVDADIFAIVKP